MYQLVMFLSMFEMVWNFPNYSLEIPNGFAVPDPCSGGERTFPAVGHWQRAPHLVSFSFDGSTFNSFERNPFGFVSTYLIYLLVQLSFSFYFKLDLISTKIKSVYKSIYL